MNITQSDIERFESKYIPVTESGCWIWMGTIEKRDTHLKYGRFWIGEKQIPAHRASWNIHKGDIPKGLYVCHKCDIPECVNPNHLFLGTPQDNTIDCSKKKRLKISKGEENGGAKLRDIQVLEIREMLKDEVKISHIAKHFKISRKIIYNIRDGIYWAHIGVTH